MIRADLHTHTHLSDGTFSPEHLVSFMKKEGVQFLSITDHDCCDAYQEIEEDEFIIPGVEFSVRFNGKELHLLGYFPQTFHKKPSQEVVDYLKRTQESRKKRALTFLGDMGERGIKLSIKDIQKFQLGPILTRYHIAQALSATGYTKSISNAFKKYLSYDLGLMQLTPNTAEEVISLVHRAKGLVFWAHPKLSMLEDFLPDFVALGLDGLEMVRMAGPRIHSLCRENKLLVSWGTDFHSYRQDRKAGMLVEESIFAEFCDRLGVRSELVSAIQ